MLERTPYPKPLPCFGSELNLGDAMCKACSHLEGCKNATGIRLTKVPISKCRFDFTVNIQDVEVESKENIYLTYAECHETIYGETPTRPLPRGAEEKIKQNAEALECDVKLLIMVTMMAQQIKKEPFFPTLLVGPSAIKRFKMYRDECRRQYGRFDTDALSLLMGKPKKEDLRERLGASEVIFGQMVVGFMLRSDAKPFRRVYQLRESAFDPTWLAVEPTYDDVLKDHAKTADSRVTSFEHKLRFSVAKAKQKLKRNKDLLKSVLVARQSIMIDSATTVLGYHHIGIDDFQVENRPIVSASSFWMLLGRALNQHYCWRAAQGDKRAMEKISSDVH